ncbi:DNA helicase IV [Vibrio algivorus]|uniref:DNA 3'-5' helicase n=1 Tax=Vibrio algivorus TaxID=1667024 RepID=A0A557P7W4_9VIBR|nr:DNA helicase IV [Vibrio algivorus]TVO36754.1 DNA helicase IV [Vibrio algivorus]
MQLSASRFAQFFIQDEYQQVEVKDQCITLSSPTDELQIPFAAWNGEVTVERGLIWGNLYFHAHEEEEDEQIQWLAQGLPWLDCQHFAQLVVAEYRRWQLNQSESLAELLPSWLEQLKELVNQPGYLTHSSLEFWMKGISDDLAKKELSLPEVIHIFPSHNEWEGDDQFQHHTPSLMSGLKRWLTHPKASLEQRNQTWLANQEIEWKPYFQECERSPLNASQQRAVLLNDDHTLILAGAGSGKTSVLMAKVGYLLQSGQAKPEEMLLVAFGRDAAKEMQQRIKEKFAEQGAQIKVQTFHQLGLDIIKSVEGSQVEISPLATTPAQKTAWFSQWLKTHWMTETNFRRWQKHLAEWPIAFLKGDVELGSHVENPKLLAWLEQQVDQLSVLQLPKKQLQERLIELENYPQLNSELMLAWPCYQAWQKMLKEENQIDFNSMISKATQYARNGKFKSQWRFMMVDEYQDISPNRLDLLTSICHGNVHKTQLGETTTQQPCSLFAVGDDWQAIYRFAGADVNLTTGFKKRFPNAQIHYLDTTYRFNNQIGEVANRFIQANPYQLEKTLNSHKQQKQKAVTIAPMHTLETVLSDLNNQVKSRKKVLVLGRNHYHEPSDLKTLQKRNLHLDIEFKTCHASKGQEADYVVIVSVDEGQFPAVERQQHLHDALLSSDDVFPNAEERRLFYVAMTRAKEKVWILHNANPSTFIKELRVNRYPVVVKKR